MTPREHPSRQSGGRLLLESLTLTMLFFVLASIFLFMQNVLLPGRPLLFSSAGLALAVFMLQGWRGIPIVGLGTLAFCLAQTEANHSLSGLTAMILGSTVQATLAAWLIGRRCGWGVFATPASVQRMLAATPLRLGVSFVVLVTLISTLAPSVGTISLLLSGDTNWALAAAVWQNNWLGSLASMLAWGPLLFFSARSWGKVAPQRDPIVFCLAGLIAAAGVIAFANIQQSDRKQERDRLLTDAQEIVSLHNSLMQAQMAQLVALKAFMESQKEVTAQEFETFATQLLGSDSTLRTLSWIVQVPAAERVNFERQLQQPGQARFFITDVGPDGTPRVAPSRPTYFPITFAAPLQTYLAIRGRDAALDPTRRDLIERARDSGEVTASAPTRLFYSDATLPVVLTVLPLYHKSMPLATVTQRQQAFKGVVLSAFEPNERYAFIRKTLRPTPIDFFVFEQRYDPVDAPAQLIAWSLANTHAAPPPDLDPATLHQGLYAERQFSFANRSRLLIVRPVANVSVMVRYLDGWLILALSWLLSGTLLYFMGRREAQDKSLRQSNDRRAEEAVFTRQLLEQLPIGVTVHNLQGDVIDANPAFCDLLGRSRTQTQGLRNAQITPPEFMERDVAQMQILNSTGAYGPYEKEFLHADGSSVPVLMRGLLTERHGQAVILSVAEDISARRKAEFQLAQSQKMDAIGQLTGGLAHDFNNMLGVIIGNLDLLTSSLSGNTAAQGHVDVALNAALQGADLTRALLAVARRQASSTEPVELNSRLQELLPLLQHTAGQTIKVSLQLSAHPVVEIDPGGLASTVLNLVLNARDAMPEGGHLTLATQLRTVHADDISSTLKPGPYAELSVSDTGSGMSAQVLARVLEPFFTTKERGRGTGLGLSMAYGFVKQCGGDLLIYSEPGHGTTLRLMLPIAALSIASGTTSASVDVDATPEFLPRGSERVLVVDDELELLVVTATWLKALDYDVTPCASPTSALAALHDGATSGRPYALMVTDITMPGLDGFALARAAREAHPTLALLYISGFADAALRGHNRPDGVILEKPFRQPALATLARQALDNSLKANL
jgi:PAS domain S-box-containing protein